MHKCLLIKSTGDEISFIGCIFKFNKIFAYDEKCIHAINNNGYTKEFVRIVDYQHEFLKGSF